MRVLAPEFHVPGDVLELAGRIRLIVFDVDGVLTDGSLYLGDDGQEYKSFHSRDGHGMKMLMGQGVDVAIITGRTSRVVEQRAADLGISRVFQGAGEKLPVFRDLLDDAGLDASQAAYVGDDVVDLPIMLHCGLSIAVADAHPLVRRHAHWVTPSGGGRGAAREICDMLLFAQQRLDVAVQPYFG
jgi:3-deoxy-D-manno-octulosonate 8-phosphate phosphatase (KDO 8-P phosphatase)